MVEGNYVSQGDILWPCQILAWQRWFDTQESQIYFIAPLISLWWWITILRRVENNFLGLGSLEKSNRGVGNSVQPMFLLEESIFRKSAWKGKSEGSFSVASIFSALLGYSSCYKSLVQLRSCSAPPTALVFAWIVIQLRFENPHYGPSLAAQDGYCGHLPTCLKAMMPIYGHGYGNRGYEYDSALLEI